MRSLAVARELKSHFEILFVHSPEYESIIRECGFQSIEFQHLEVDEVIEKSSDFNFDWINSKTINSLFQAQLKIVEEYKPDILVSDTSLTLPMLGEYFNIPVVSIQNAYTSNLYDDIRPIPYVHKGYKYQFLMPEPTWVKILKTAERASMKFVHRPFAKLRKTLDLSKKQWLLDEFEGDFNLICDLPALFPVKNLPDQFYAVGPALYHSRQEESDLLTWISQGDTPIVYVSLGSSGRRVSLDFLNDEAAKLYRFIVSGAKPVQSRDNVYYQKFVNFDAIKQHVKLYVSHGGNGSIYQAIAAKIPLLVMPAFFEQEWNAHRVKATNIGVVLHPNEMDSFWTNLENLLNGENALDVNQMHAKFASTHFESNVITAFKQFNLLK